MFERLWAIIGRFLPLAAMLACGTAPAPLTLSAAPPQPASPDSPVPWSEDARSPQPQEPQPGFAGELAKLCGVTDAGLTRVAGELAQGLMERRPASDPAEITHALRRAGSPYVWPKAWTLHAPSGRREQTQARMLAWLASFEGGGERRCGISLRSSAAAELVAVIAVDALADLRPLPLRTRKAAWVDVEAELLVQAVGAKVIVLGPRGPPRILPTSLQGRRILARFNADREGQWLVQVLADVLGGPRPVLESWVFAGVEPADSASALAAESKESEAHASRDPEGALERMIQAVRREERLPVLARDPRLDRLAAEHAQRMRRERRVAHDVGDGDPSLRIEQAGLSASATGENVAHAGSIARAHRVLWGSPSHRANLLNQEFDAVGIGVAADADGSFWVCQLFARGLP